MNKIAIIIKREYLTRVKKKSFIIMTIIGPILMAALFIAPAWLGQMEDTEIKKIAVIDSSKIFIDFLPETQYIKFEYINNTSIAEAEKNLTKDGYYALLFIPHNILSSNRVELSSPSQPTLSVKMHIMNSIARDIESIKLVKLDIDKDVLKSVKTDINISTIKLNEDGTKEVSSTEISMILGIAGGILIYMFIFLYGAQVMRGVIEEKTSRIIEVIVSSVKPFQLMMGKIIGVALVGLTQFLMWIIFTFVLITVAQKVLTPDIATAINQSAPTNIMETQGSNAAINPDELGEVLNSSKFDNMFSSLNSINFGVMIGSFLFFFLGGYLLYSAMFAAIGSAVDNETDTQQFMLPVTIPLILAIVLLQNVVNNPQGPLAFWFSMIPFTSPIVMMVRIPFGVPMEQIIISGALLLLTFIVMVWLAGKIYRTGILMYGKKVNYREIFKWIRYRNY